MKRRRMLCWSFAAMPAVRSRRCPNRRQDRAAHRIVAFGDSLTAGLGLPQDEAFPAQLEAALKARGQAVSVVNAGVSGDTAAAGLARLDWALPDDASAVIVELGGNDALQGMPPEGTKASLEKIIEQLQAKGCRSCSPAWRRRATWARTMWRRSRAIYPDLAERYGVIFYPFFLDGAALNDGLMQADGIHPNAKGVARIVEGILPKVEELLAKVAAKN